MTYQVIWTNKARETYNQNLDYLLQNWEDKVYNDFVNRVEVVVDHLRQNPKMFIAIDVNRNIYRCVVTKHVSADEDDSWKGREEQVKYLPLQAQEGDLAIYLQKGAIEVVYEGEKYFIVPQASILMLEREEDLI
jgi:plasmid stabilization system protein ParE